MSLFLPLALNPLCLIAHNHCSEGPDWPGALAKQKKMLNIKDPPEISMKTNESMDCGVIVPDGFQRMHDMLFRINAIHVISTYGPHPT